MYVDVVCVCGCVARVAVGLADVELIGPQPDIWLY